MDTELVGERVVLMTTSLLNLTSMRRYYIIRTNKREKGGSK